MNQTQSATEKKTRALILGIGNFLMGDEGVGPAVVRELEKMPWLPESIRVVDGGTGGFTLLEAMQAAEKVILIDAAADGAPSGTVRRLQPRYSKDYPRTLTAHDIGLKDLLDSFYLLGDAPNVTLFAVSIEDYQELSVELSPALRRVVPRVAHMALAEALAH